MEKSNNSTFVILIFEISKYQSFYISAFQILTPILLYYGNIEKFDDIILIFFAGILQSVSWKVQIRS